MTSRSPPDRTTFYSLNNNNKRHTITGDILFGDCVGFVSRRLRGGSLPDVTEEGSLSDTAGPPTSSAPLSQQGDYQYPYSIGSAEARSRQGSLAAAANAASPRPEYHSTAAHATAAAAAHQRQLTETSSVDGGECTLRRRCSRQRRMPLRKYQPHTLDQILTNCNARAMRYYRIWIYTCNAVLFLSVMAFCAVAARVLIFDYRRYLIPNLALYQPSFLYAYLALFTQSGVLQVIGCLGALRLSERLLNVYWLMLLILLFGDVVIGIFWVFRFDKICQELKPSLKFRLHHEYGYNNDLTLLWDRLQTDYACCGVQDAMDFGHVNRTGAHMLAWIPETNPAATYVVPQSCCTMTEDRPLNTSGNTTEDQKIPHRTLCQEVHSDNCGEKLQTYLRQSADILFILGYCVIAFLKLCFLGILRYEIREMIQKIKILQSEMDARPSIISLDNSSQNLGMSSPSRTVLINTSSANGSVPGGACDTTRTSSLHKPSYESTESERESLLVKEQEQNIPLHPQKSFLSAENLEYHQKTLQETCRQKLFPGDAAADSDTNSHCALLVDEVTASPPATSSQHKNPNGNNNYELHEFQSGATTSNTQRQAGRLSKPDTEVTQNI